MRSSVLPYGFSLEEMRLEAAVVDRQLLLDDVRLDGDAQVVGLAGQVGRHVVVLVLLEGVVAGVAPQDGGQADLVGGVEHLADLDDLPAGLGRAEVDGGADGRRAHVERLLHVAEHDLVELVRVGQELVVVHLHDERDPVGVLAGDRAQHAQGRGHGVAAALDGQLHDVLGVEVVGVGRERGAGRVLDALVDRQDRQVARARQAAVPEQRLQVAQHRRRPIRQTVGPVDVVGARASMQAIGRDLGLVRQQVFGVGTQDLLHVEGHAGRSHTRAGWWVATPESIRP